MTTREPFTPEHVDSDRILDANGRDVGRLLATEGGHGANMRVVMRLNEDVRGERRVKTEKIVVPARHFELFDGEPRLDCTLDEILEETGEPHVTSEGTVTKGAEPRPEHFGAPADETKAAGSASTRSRGDNESLEKTAKRDPRVAE